MIRVAVVGLGKIAHDQHLPAIAASPAFELICGASLEGECPSGRTYRDVEVMLAAEPSLEAVVLCQPPQARYAAARAALLAGRHVFLEKPPGATVAEVEALIALANSRGRTLFAAWHSRYASGVEPARAWLADKTVRRAEIIWREDVRVWHPGQPWIWRPGGLGVFDPGINALSIATHVLPLFRLVDGVLCYPSNQAAPIAAALNFETTEGAPIAANFDFRQQGDQTWDIRIETDKGVLLLTDGGARLVISGSPYPLPHSSEYVCLYARFADLIAREARDVDLRPLGHVADAFLRADRRMVEAFID